MIKVLIDENLPIRCRGWFPDGVAQTVQYRGWKGLRNGELLSLAVQHGFTSFLTCDGAIPREQPPHLLTRIGIVIVPTNDWAVLRHMAERIIVAATTTPPGSIVRIPWS